MCGTFIICNLLLISHYKLLTIYFFDKMIHVIETPNIFSKKIIRNRKLINILYLKLKIHEQSVIKVHFLLIT